MARTGLHWLTHNGRNISLAAVVLIALSFLGIKLPAATGTFTLAFRHVTSSRIVWLFAALGAEAGSFLAIGLANRQLVHAAGQRIGLIWSALLTFASNGLLSLIPGGMVPATGWLVDQYRRRGIDQQAALWTVVASSFSVAVTALGLLLVGCGAAGVGPSWALLLSGAGLVAGSIAFLRGARSLRRPERWLSRHGQRGPGFRALHRLSITCAELGQWRAGYATGTIVLLLSGVSWICQWMALVATFQVLGFHARADSLLFAFTASEVLGAIVPLPAGVGVVEGGLVGALALTGMPIGRALVGVVMFRVVSYWLVTGASALTLVVVSHRTRNLTGVQEVPSPAAPVVRVPSAPAAPAAPVVPSAPAASVVPSGPVAP
ncbi:MAG: lysylphosphatidylglycerol synthase transmembrane domain-containing protein, partial [Acidimicrobiales bacterium]